VLSERYELLQPLGKGGMGIVFKAQDSALEEIVALKLLRSDIAETPDIARRFRQEIRLARKVRHRNVCGIHEYGEDGGIRYISMEFIEGVDLRQILRQKGVPRAPEAFDISIQIAEGLDAIHEAGIIHRDLKTANIMIDGQGCVRLMDFGIAKQAGSEATLGGTALGMIIGTPEYMSPEQGRGEKIDFRTDVYSLGIMVYEIFTGHLPFKGDTPIATIFKHIQEPPPLTGERAARLPGPLVPVLSRALGKTPQERYTTVGDMLQALRDARAASTLPGQGAPRTAVRRPIVPGAAVPQIEPAPRGQLVPTSVSTKVPTSVHTAVPTGIPLEARAEPTGATTPQPRLDPAVAVRPAAERILDLIQTGKLDTAAAALTEAERVYAGVPPLPDLRSRLTEEEHRQRLNLLLGRAENLLASASLDEARQALDQALELQPEAPPRLREIEKRLATALQQRDERLRRERALEEALARARGAIEKGALDVAARELSEIEASFGSLEPVRALRARLASEEERARKALLSSWLERAQSLLAGGDPSEARAAVLEAQKVDAQDRRARQLLSRIDGELAKRADTERRSQALEAAVSAARALADRGALDEAMTLLARSERENGACDASRALHKRIEDLRRQRAEEQKRRERELKRQQRAAAAPSPEKSGAPARAGRPWLVAGAGGAAAVVGLVVGVVVWNRPGPNPASVSPSPVEAVTEPSVAEHLTGGETPTSVPPAAGDGILVIDATPWAEVVSVVAPDGKPQALGTTRYTPAVIHLPEGSYTISLRHPLFGLSRATVAVRSAATSRHVVELGRIDPREYLKEAGF
jgi:predicted Ser/Thr protein kinase